MLSNGFRHPGVHILLLGLLVAGAILVVHGPPTGAADRRVVITGGDLLQLRAGFMRTWQREPTEAELGALLDQHIRQEVLYREALARGYDRDDAVVRRAMQQKMEFLAASQSAQEPPADAEIEAFFTLRQERYRLSPELSLAQIYVSLDGDPALGEARAAELLSRLEREDPGPENLADYGDGIMLPSFYAGATDAELRAAFGEDFTQEVLGLDPGSWQGPIRSGYGLHLVKVTERQGSQIPPWTEVRAMVVRDMEYEARNAAREQLYQEIAQSYQIVTDSQVAQVLESATE